MKKIRLLLFFPLILAFLFSARLSLAQSPSSDATNPLFDMSKPVATSFIEYGNSQPKRIEIPPFTAVFIPANSFKDSVTVNIYKGNWDKIKGFLPKDQSSISSYYVVFIDSKGKMVLPSNNINIVSFNNFVDTDTFFYPINAQGGIDVANSKKWQGHIKVDTELPIQDSAFVVAVNKVLEKNDYALNPRLGLGTPAAKPAISLYSQKLITFGFLIATAFLLLVLLWKNNKKSQKK